MKKNIFSWMTIMLMAFAVCVGFSACGGDDDDEQDSRTNSTGSTGSGGSGTTTGDVLKPGVYFCLEMSQFHSYLTHIAAEVRLTH